ncbi:centriolar and ciliogenesis-associated protein HYLS1-like [Mya arenaria]|uniref:centriolar and ciliogenesis-associated protein HYLS1-like n=1 Tax=Mya arenaria TaxID=6604 RepID=UPI0022E0A366|nr:centriolar and ciliogenesis-associated protein HYLS1-like [Mya arenaria]XP_052767352.1 centriolar and ciliogenesis-associated protein HYLS1-like [Mya arenaria]XP_052767353.1 centriolar and ciliogenesis-associated protein HYLS1-like [Mya arenaria]XP_052767354.1 centriolar and ciliogenesis-associated protein HYLS1-like [Mya arenaria]
MDDNLEFTDDEIREELGKLGYPNVPESRLAEFKKDLGRLISHERSKSSQNTSLSSHVPTDTSINGVRIEGKTRSPLEESPLERQVPDLAADRRQYCQWRTGKENQGRPESPKDVHHIPRKPDAKFSMYEPEADLSQYSLRDDVSETDSERRMVKRKVLRKDKDGSKHVDESMTESDFGSIQDINERLRELGIIDRVDFFSKRRPQSSRSEPPYRLSPDDPRPSSVILRKPEHPHTRNIKKTDPVARYQQFRQSWSAQRAPGEKNHKNLRWNVREQMLAQDVVYEKKPHRVFVPNKYTVPSDKKRQSLRWQIRTDMAQGQLPHHGFYAEY